MDRFDWLVGQRAIRLYNENNHQADIADTLSDDKLVNYKFPGTEFVSTHPLQDSLRFFSSRQPMTLIPISSVLRM